MQSVIDRFGDYEDSRLKVPPTALFILMTKGISFKTNG
jgi:hypothetical protein